MPAASPKNLPYFTAVMVAYVAGLVATILAMNIFEAAQPALIYLVPFCLLTVLALAAARGEFEDVWGYSEEDEEVDDSDDAKAKAAKAAKAARADVSGAADATEAEAKKDL
jgi:minor histocompatibility antigen H13